MPGVQIGKGAFISAGAHVHGDIPVGAVVAGKNGYVVNHVSRLIDLESGTRHPWMRHYKEAYPIKAHQQIKQLIAVIMENRLTLKIEGI